VTGGANAADCSGAEIKLAALAHRVRQWFQSQGSISETKMKTIVTVFLFCRMATAQDMQSCPMHKQHQAEVEKHGHEAMGFSHDKTTHHFHLSPDGGTIEVIINDSKDAKDLQAIRSHSCNLWRPRRSLSD